MTTFFEHKKIEKKWQDAWAASDLYQAKDPLTSSGRVAGKKKYILDMFPYPSGAGLHVGHPESYTATDIMARYYRSRGFNVLHPMGWDAFGLPAENYAIQSGVHPQTTTNQSIDNFRRQIKMLGFSYDWSREVNTSAPDYYKWTQWLFLQLYKKGLAYKKQAPVNWCDSCQTVLANEQVVDGKCERCSNAVIQKDLEQWFFKVTEYADELLSSMKNLDWSDSLKVTQANWIGREEKNVKGKKTVQYHIHDWLVSRQRYWGAPIPIIYCDKCREVPVPEKDLPVLLPEDVDFKPTGESPLARSKSFHQVTCPKCGQPARRESDTMDTFVCSSWYFLRYCDPQNKKEIFDKKKVKFWLPVDLYIGGMEHAVGHLIYSRFIVKVLRDLGFLGIDEPFLKIRNQGIILAEDGRKMSKRWNNVINPDDVVEEYGADSMRLYEMFMGPLEDMKPWSQKGIIGVRRFLEKVHKFSVNTQFLTSAPELEKLLHKTIKKVTEDIETIHFNTAISSMMIFVNEVVGQTISQYDWEKFLIILSPFAPHLAEELWQALGHQESIFKQSWPDYDKKLVIDEEVTIAIQVNGKLRETIVVERGLSESKLRTMVEDLPNIKKYLAVGEVKKFIYIKDKLVNIVIENVNR